jgi:hypothetical protein
VEAAGSPETPVHFYHVIQRHIQADSSLRNARARLCAHLLEMVQNLESTSSAGVTFGIDNDTLNGHDFKYQRDLNEQYSLQNVGSNYSEGSQQWHPTFLEAEDRYGVVIVSLLSVYWESTRVLF